MAVAEQPLAGLVRPQAAVSTELADQWRRLTRAATVVALLTSPALFIWFKQYNGWSTLWSLLATLGVVIVFRGFADLIFRKLIPSAKDEPEIVIEGAGHFLQEEKGEEIAHHIGSFSERTPAQ